MKESYVGGGISDADKAKLADSAAATIDVKIKSCGDFIRKLKAEKAAKDVVTKEVRLKCICLLAIKATLVSVHSPSPLILIIGGGSQVAEVFVQRENRQRMVSRRRPGFASAQRGEKSQGEQARQRSEQAGIQ
jgi:hypothetical protein